MVDPWAMVTPAPFPSWAAAVDDRHCRSLKAESSFGVVPVALQSYPGLQEDALFVRFPR